MKIPLLLAQPHQAIALQCGEECPAAAVNQLQILRGSVPAIEQNGPRLDFFLRPCIHKHLVKVIVFGLAINLRGIYSIVNRVEVLLIFAGTVDKADHANPSDHSMLSATILRADQFDETGIPFVMHAIVHDQKGVFAVLDPVFDQLPYLTGPKSLLAQEIINYVVTDVVQVFSQVCTGTVLGRAHQILDILLLGNHKRRMLLSVLKRKSCQYLVMPLLWKKSR